MKKNGSIILVCASLFLGIRHVNAMQQQEGIEDMHAAHQEICMPCVVLGGMTALGQRLDRFERTLEMTQTAVQNLAQVISLQTYLLLNMQAQQQPSAQDQSFEHGVQHASDTIESETYASLQMPTSSSTSEGMHATFELPALYPVSPIYNESNEWQMPVTTQINPEAAPPEKNEEDIYQEILQIIKTYGPLSRHDIKQKLAYYTEGDLKKKLHTLRTKKLLRFSRKGKKTLWALEHPDQNISLSRLSPLQTKILAILSQAPSLNMREIRQRFIAQLPAGARGKSHSSIYYNLKLLRKKGLIQLSYDDHYTLTWSMKNNNVDVSTTATLSTSSPDITISNQ